MRLTKATGLAGFITISTLSRLILYSETKFLSLEKKTTARRFRLTKKDIVHLRDEEREYLTGIITKEQAAADKLKSAQSLRNADTDGPTRTAEPMAGTVSVPKHTVSGVRLRVVAEGREATLNHQKPARPPRLPQFVGETEAKRMALRGGPPAGYARGTLRRLAEIVVAVAMWDSVSAETVRPPLTTHELKPQLRKGWVMPPAPTAELVVTLEELLEVYGRP